MTTHSSDRMTKEKAAYVEWTETRDTCGECAMYAVPGRCTIVEGWISKEGTCMLWEARRDRRT
jgi:hypothetical protein